MKRAVFVSLALFCACSTAAIAQYEDRNTQNDQNYNGARSNQGTNPYYRDQGKANSDYGQPDSSRWNRNAQNDRGYNGSRSNEGTSPYYRDQGKANSDYGQPDNGSRHANDQSGRHSDRYGSMANNGEYGGTNSRDRDGRYGSDTSGRYHAAYHYRRHCGWQHSHHACYRVRY